MIQACIISLYFFSLPIVWTRRCCSLCSSLLWAGCSASKAKNQFKCYLLPINGVCCHMSPCHSWWYFGSNSPKPHETSIRCWKITYAHYPKSNRITTRKHGISLALGNSNCLLLTWVILSVKVATNHLLKNVKGSLSRQRDAHVICAVFSKQYLGKYQQLERSLCSACR